MNARLVMLRNRAIDVYGEVGGDQWIFNWLEGDPASRTRLEEILSDAEEVGLLHPRVEKIYQPGASDEWLKTWREGDRLTRRKMEQTLAAFEDGAFL